MTPFVNVSNMHGGLFLSNKNNTANYYIKNNRGGIISKEDTNRVHNDKPIAKLLIVDDEPEILQVLQIGLEQMDSWWMDLPIQKRHYKASNPMQRVSA
jgi:hypothetical protein